MRRAHLFILPLSALLSPGCGVLELEILTTRQQQNDNLYVCPNGEQVRIDSSEAGRPKDISEECVGLRPRCPSTISGPEDSRCSDPTLNRFRGTCVEAFFACAELGGTCSGDPESGGARWSNGARQTPEAFFPPGEAEPCLLIERRSDVPIGDRYGRLL